MALGKAFIEVHADTKPFARELEREITRLTKSAENGSLKDGGRKLGQSLGDGISEGVDKSKKKVSQSIKDVVPGEAESQGFFSRMAKGIIDTIDDGLSGLPAELKVGLGAALLAITPFLGASIAAIVSSALVAGFATFGTIFAFQFERVRVAGKEMVSFMRDLFSNAARPFIEPVLAAIRMIEEGFLNLTPTIRGIFETAATFVEPLTKGVIGFFDQLLPDVQTSLDNISDTVDTLAFHFETLGAIIGRALVIMTGASNLDEGLNDFLTIVETLILSAAILVRVLTELYKVFRLILMVITPLGALTGEFDTTRKVVHEAREEVGGFQSTLDDLVAPTDEETKALEEINQQLTDFVTNTGNAWQSNINFEESLDDMEATLKKNKGALDLNTAAGRANQQAILDASQALVKQRNDTIALTGNVAEANRVFEINKARLEESANKAKISDKAFRDLTGAILSIPPPITESISPSYTAGVQGATNAWNTLRLAILRAAAAAVTAPAGSSALGTFRGYADGGVITSPTLGLVGEAGPEAIIPLSNPRRAAQVMNEAGLTGGSSNVAVYIGNREIDAYIDKRVDTRLSMTARSMSYGVRAL